MADVPFVFSHWDKAPEENFVIGQVGEEPIYYFIDWDEVGCLPALDDARGLIWEGRSEQEKTILFERYWDCVRGSPFVPFQDHQWKPMVRHYQLLEAMRQVHFGAYHMAWRLAQQEGTVTEHFHTKTLM